MKLFRLLALSALIILAACKPEDKPSEFIPGQSHSTDREGGGKNQPDFTRLTAANHPRILLTDETVNAIKARLDAGDAIIKSLHSVIMNAADGYLHAKPLTHTLIGVRLLDTSDAANNQINCLGYAWRLTGDTRYRDKAVSILETVCDFPDWNAPTHFLDAGEMAYAVGVGYDWLYSELSTEQKRKIVSALDKYAFQNAINKKWNLNFYESATNWNQVCNGGLVTAALACYEDCAANAKTIIDKGVESNLRMAAQMYNPDGNYPEGYGYWGYGSSYECLLLSSLESALGSDYGINDIPGWKKSGKWILFMECMNGRCFNYCDCDATSDPRPPLWYMAWKFNDPSLVYIELDKLAAGDYPRGGINKYMPMVVASASKFEASSIKAPSEHFWKGGGENPVALVHGDWSFSASDMMLGVKAGRCDYSHGHMDVGSFVFDSQGVNWSVDLGLQDYNSMASAAQAAGRSAGYSQDSMRWDFLRYNNLNHSTITINGAKHLVGARVSFTESYDTDAKRGVKLNMTSAVSDQCRSAYRTVTWENNRDLVIVDEIGAQLLSSAKLRWTMVTMAVPTVLEDGIKLESKGRTLYIKSTNDLGIKLNWKTWPTSGHSYDASNDGYYECGFEATVTSGKTCIFTTTLTPDA